MQRVFFVLAVGLIAFISACSRQEIDFERATKSAEKGHYVIALSQYESAIRRNPTSQTSIAAAKEAAQIAELQVKDYKRAILFYKHIISYSKNTNERLQAQKAIAVIQFDKQQDYLAAVAEYNKLLTLSLSESDRANYKMVLSRANYYLGNFDQALSELEDLLRLKLEENVLFSALLLRANIFVGQKQFQKAAESYKELIKQFPNRSLKEGVFLSLAVSYEESENYTAALAILEQNVEIYKPREYVELRIKRLRERQKNQPGARGLRK